VTRGGVTLCVCGGGGGWQTWQERQRLGGSEEGGERVWGCEDGGASVWRCEVSGGSARQQKVVLELVVRVVVRVPAESDDVGIR
jgi:hypothetical protein